MRSRYEECRDYFSHRNNVHIFQVSYAVLLLTVISKLEEVLKVILSYLDMKVKNQRDISKYIQEHSKK